jgi:hypothetical protein
MSSPTLDPRLQLVPPGTKPRLLMFLLCVMLPFVTTAVALWWMVRSGEAMNLIGDDVSLTVLLTAGGVLALVLAIWFMLDRAMHRHRLLLTPLALEVKTSFYSTLVPLSELNLEQARVIDLHERIEFKPRLKTNGYAIAGFNSGHFRLKNGEKAFVAMAGERRALWLPTSRGKGLLLQPRQPEALLKRLRELAGTPAHR